MDFYLVSVNNRNRSLSQLQRYYKTRLRSLYKVKRIIIEDVEGINLKGECLVTIKTNLTNKNYNIKIIARSGKYQFPRLCFICPTCGRQVRLLYLIHNKFNCTECLPFCPGSIREAEKKGNHHRILYYTAKSLAVEKRLVQASKEEKLVLLKEEKYYFKKVRDLLIDPSLFKAPELEKKYKETITSLNRKLELSNKLKK